MEPTNVGGKVYRSIEHRKIIVTLDFQGTGIPMTIPRGASMEALRAELRKKLGR